ncbi:MAG: AAA family ATPase [Proteobacteria bacterium]|nr:AAA family ATPase [Pseudomonadota bacterium]
MGEHLLQQTLSPEMAAMAEYYEQGVRPPTPADTVTSRYGRFALIASIEGQTLDDLVKAEADRLADSALASEGRSLDWDVLVLHAVAAFVGTSLLSREAALATAERLDAVVEPDQLDRATKRARTERDYSSATATPRRDMNPALAQRLGIDPHRALRPGEVAQLLNGQRADGGFIEGRAQQAASVPLAQVFGLEPGVRPTRAELEHVLAGRKTDGDALPPKEAMRSVRRFQAALGARSKTLSPAERENILSGRTADGRELTDRQYQAVLDTSKSRIGYIDLTFSAPKSVSIAWAFGHTTAERAIIHQAHKDAIDSVMLAIEKEIGRASKGRSARYGYEAGSIGWVSFDHYASRPTVEVIRTDELGQHVTELHRLTSTKGRVPGDMQVHTHVAVPNVVETPSGRVGSLDLAQLEGRIHEWGALYQAYLASNLRVHGVRIELDQRTEMARVSAVPDNVIAQFSRRTLNGTDAARAYAQSQGLDWDSLDPDRKVALLKSGVQNRREGKADDVGDLEAWRRAATTIGYEHRSVLQPEKPIPMPERTQRLETAYQVAVPLLAKQFDRRAVIDGADARIAAAKGLIAAGVESAEDVNAITRAFEERGIRRRGEDAALIWGTVQGKQGRARVAITTTLDVREEQALIAVARAGSRDRRSALSAQQIKSAIASFPEIDFTGAHGRAQRKIVDQLGKGGRISVAIGVAGSGKSTLLKPLVRAWRDDGRAVYGIALAWRQSDDLTDSGIEARNTRAVASFLRAAQAGAIRLDRKSVVVIDEVGLLGTRQLNDILAVQKKDEFQLVMLGDPRQMQSVEAGSVIELLRRALGERNVPELASSVRQKDAEEREAALMFRNGQTAEAVRRKDANGTLHIVPGGYREAVEHVAELWEQRRHANRSRPGFTISVSAPTNAQAHDISLAIREQRKNFGEISADRIKVRATDSEGTHEYSLALAPGDRVRLFKRTNAKFNGAGTIGNIGRNGTVLEVVEIRDEGLMLRNPTGKEGLVVWSSLKNEGNGRVLLAYGDALTTNTAQGTTVTEHIHAIPAGSRLVSAFGAYTSGSRHREQSFIVTSEGAERAEIAARRPLGDRREIMRGDILNNITRNFSQQPVKEAALDMLDRAASLRRGTIRAVQTSLQSMEARASARESPSVLNVRFMDQRVHRALEDRLPGLVERLSRYSETLARVVRTGAAIVDGLRRIDLRRNITQTNETEYWRNIETVRKDMMAVQEKGRAQDRPRVRGRSR